MRARIVSSLVLAALVVVGGCSKDPEVAKKEHVASGDKYLAEGKTKEAIVEYRNAVQQDAKFGEARLKLAEAYTEGGRPPATRSASTCERRTCCRRMSRRK